MGAFSAASGLDCAGADWLPRRTIAHDRRLGKGPQSWTIAPCSCTSTTPTRPPASTSRPAWPRTFAAELAGAYLVPTRELTPFTSAMLPDSVVEHRLRDSGEAQARAEVRFREAAARHGLPNASWSAPAGRAIDAGILHARYADLAILGQPRERRSARRVRQRPRARGADARRTARADRAACERRDVGRRNACSWRGRSRASPRAPWPTRCRSSQRAREVVVVSISARGDESVRETLADQDIAAWLARHGIAASVRHEVAEDVDAGHLLLSRAADFGADLIVMGAYSRPRLSEIVLGGVTRLMLRVDDGAGADVALAAEAVPCSARGSSPISTWTRSTRRSSFCAIRSCAGSRW